MLLITLDTTRKDALGCYGAKTPTPHLDAIAAQGARFDRAYTVTPVTLPAHTSLLTGTYPAYHGVRDNGPFRLVPGAVTLAETLRRAGWSTAGCISAFVLDRLFGLDQGFDHYDDDFQVKFGGTVGVEERDAGAVTDAALRWLDTSLRQPFFLWVHYFDPHQPLTAPEPYAKACDNPYTAEVVYVDAQIGRLIAALEQKGLTRNLLTVVVADHGEALGEHGEATHGIFLYEATLAIPLIVGGEGIEPGKHVPSLVSIVDVAPTILELLGLAIPDSMQGRSLAPLLASGKPGESTPLYIENHLTRLTYGWAPLSGVIQDALKYIEAPRPELYDITADPREAVNLVGERASEARRLAQLTQALREKHAPPDGVPWADQLELSEESREKLKELGYLTPSPGEVETTGIDPKDALEENRLIDEAALLQQNNRFEEAVALFKQILERNPKNGWVLQHLGTSLVGTGRYAEAIPYLERAIESRRVIGPPLYNLAHAYERTGRSAEALALIGEIREKNPKYTPAHQWLGLYHEARGEWPQAIDAYEAFLRHWKGDEAIGQRIRAKVEELRKK
ncbi:MAG: sulfatase-like hydrolase/transferase [Planctomycetota bacterium]